MGGHAPFRRAIIIVLDGLGVGELPDAECYDDADSNTLVHIAEAVGGLDLPNLQRLGLGHIVRVTGVPAVAAPAGCYGKMAERSAGKSTTVGHWELAGVVTERPSPTYPEGFPADIIAAFEEATGRHVLWNRPASGTEIIERLGPEHLRTGDLIVYTSADSVFQVAAHEDKVPVDELYEACRAARELLTGEHTVERVIARPFTGQPGCFRRTERRRDFSLLPPQPTLLDLAKEAGLPVLAVGKIDQIFAGRGITEAHHCVTNPEALTATLAYAQRRAPGIIMANLVEFDMVFGHRNDAQGFAGALEEFDGWLPKVLAIMRPDDMLFLTADHGCDPTTPGTDHSREYVPLLACGERLRPGMDLGARDTFAALGATVAEALGLDWSGKPGQSFLAETRAA